MRVVAAPHWVEYISDMQAIADSGLMLALFNLGGGEIILILALVLILFGADKLPGASRRLGRGLFSFRDAADDEAREVGRSLGGIFGNRAAQALTPDNQVAELYTPEAFEKERGSRQTPKTWWRSLRNLWRQVARFLLNFPKRTRYVKRVIIGPRSKECEHQAKQGRAGEVVDNDGPINR